VVYPAWPDICSDSWQHFKMHYGKGSSCKNSLLLSSLLAINSALPFFLYLICNFAGDTANINTPQAIIIDFNTLPNWIYFWRLKFPRKKNYRNFIQILLYKIHTVELNM
jgi:hypothetical protein